MQQNSGHGLRVGIYVDVSNLAMNGGFGMRYEVLREYACRGGGEPLRMNAYVSYDADRASIDGDYRNGQYRFHSALRDLGYRVVQKEIHWYVDDGGARIGKANVDLDLAVDALLQSDRLDRVILATGDGDYVSLVKALQQKGARVEVVAFDNVSGELRQEADSYTSGYLIPNLLPVPGSNSAYGWGEIGSYVRGVCYTHDLTKGFGFLRYVRNLHKDLWRVDARDPESAYGSMFFHDSQLPPEITADALPNRNVIFEFQIVEDQEQKKTKAVGMRCIRTRT